MRVYGPEGSRSIESLQPDDRVFCYEDGRLTVHTVTGQRKHERRPVYAVRTRNRTVTGAADHPFLVVRPVAGQVEHREDAEWAGVPVGRMAYGSRRGAICSLSTCTRSVHSAGMCHMHHTRWRKHGDPRTWNTSATCYGTSWSRLDELQRGDLLVQPREMRPEEKPAPTLPDDMPVDADVAWLLGALLGDGSLRGGDVRLTMYGEDRDRATRIVAARWRLVGDYSVHNGVRWRASGSMNRTLVMFGMGGLGPDKRVPDDVWAWPETLRRAFLDGYCDADGHRPTNVAKHGERNYFSASRELIEDVRGLHIMLGDPVSNITTTKRTGAITIRGKQVRNARDLHRFAVWRGVRGGETVFRHRPELAAWLDTGDFTIAKVLCVEPRGEQDTYDIEVEGAHNFVADGVVVHDSAFGPASCRR